jgi:hypothetical protein
MLSYRPHWPVPRGGTCGSTVSTTCGSRSRQLLEPGRLASAWAGGRVEIGRSATTAHTGATSRDEASWPLPCHRGASSRDTEPVCGSSSGRSASRPPVPLAVVRIGLTGDRYRRELWRRCHNRFLAESDISAAQSSAANDGAAQEGLSRTPHFHRASALTEHPAPW